MAVIVAADDFKDVRQMVARALERAGHTVISASNGRGALTAMRQHRPDVVVLDGQMPDLDGSEVCEAMKAEDDLAGIPVVLFSGTLSFDTPRVDGVAGAAVALGKGVPMRRLVDAVELALDTARSR